MLISLPATKDYSFSFELSAAKVNVNDVFSQLYHVIYMKAKAFIEANILLVVKTLLHFFLFPVRCQIISS